MCIYKNLEKKSQYDKMNNDILYDDDGETDRFDSFTLTDYYRERQQSI